MGRPITGSFPPAAFHPLGALGRPQKPGKAARGPLPGPRLLWRLAVCVSAGFLLALWLALPAAETFVGPPSRTARLRGTINSERGAAAGGNPAEEEQLRRRVEELEARLGDRLMQQELEQEQPQSTGPAPEGPVSKLFDQILEELPELQKVEDAKMGLTDDKTFVFQKGNTAARQPIYKRKYEVLGLTLSQQELIMKAYKKATRAAKESKAVKKLLDMMQNGGEGLSKREVQTQVMQLRQSSPAASRFFNEIVPQVTENSVGDSIAGLLATGALLLLIFAFCACLAPPVFDE